MMKENSPPPADCPDDEMIAAYLEGGLTSKEQEGLERHLVLCRECTDHLICLSEVKDSYQPKEDHFVTAAMLEKAKRLVLPADTAGFWEKLSSWFYFPRPVPVMVAASIILVIVVFGIYNLNLIDKPEEIPLSLKLGIIARVPSDLPTRATEPKYDEVEIESGGVLKSGNYFKIKFQVKEDAYAYLLSSDSQGNLIKLIPKEALELPVKLDPQKVHYFPKGDEWFKLDDHRGKEAFYLLSSIEPIKDIDQKIEHLRKSGMDKIAKIFSEAKIQSFNFKHE